MFHIHKYFSNSFGDYIPNISENIHVEPLKKLLFTSYDVKIFSGVGKKACYTDLHIEWHYTGVSFKDTSPALWCLLYIDFIWYEIS